MRERRLRYVILPRMGVLSDTIGASIVPRGGFESFGGGSAARDLRAAAEAQLTPERGAVLKSSLQKQSDDAAADLDPGVEPSRMLTDLASAIDESDFNVLAHKFADGPALVNLTATARLAFEAVNPELRIVPISTYGLPKLKLHLKKKGGAKPAATARPAGAARGAAASVTRPAQVGAAGATFDTDYKQQALTGVDGGNLGAGITVGVLDTGVDGTHPALADAIMVSRCLIADTDQTAGRPVEWGKPRAARAAHGTHVAGIIAARPGHGGPQGVAPKAGIASYRIFPDNPDREKGAENIDIINSIIAAVRDGCHVINLSIEGANLREDGVRSAIAEAWNQGVICIAAAGNGFGAPVSYPGAHFNCIAVTALGKDGCYPDDPAFHRFESDQRSVADPKVYLASFSNFGPQAKFAAPGHGIVSTFPNNQWWFDSGTSMSAPFVTGVLARLLSNQPAVAGAFGDAARSAAMLQLLTDRAKALRLPQRAEEGYGLPV